MSDQGWRIERFEAHRPHLRAVAYRMLGSLSDTDDTVQEAWLRVSRSDASVVENIGGWFTTIVARVALNMLRSRKAKREESLEMRIPDPIVSAGDGADPEPRPPSVSRSCCTTCSPCRSTRSARSRAFAAAAREGDFDALMAVLDRDVVLRSDGGATRPEDSAVVRGARAVAERAVPWASLTPHARPVLVNGAAGAVVAPASRPSAVMAFTVAAGRIVEMDILSEPVRLEGLGL